MAALGPQLLPLAGLWAELSSFMLAEEAAGSKERPVRAWPSPSAFCISL